MKKRMAIIVAVLLSTAVFAEEYRLEASTWIPTSEYYRFIKNDSFDERRREIDYYGEGASLVGHGIPEGVSSVGFNRIMFYKNIEGEFVFNIDECEYSMGDTSASGNKISFKTYVLFSKGDEDSQQDTITLEFIDRDNIVFYSAKKGNKGERMLCVSRPADITPRNAVLNDTNVRIRTKPSLNADIWGKLRKGDKAMVIGKSSDPTVIDNESHYWYRVRARYFPEGWVYGKYLDFTDEQ